jgi:hydrogenase maturation protease
MQAQLSEQSEATRTCARPILVLGLGNILLRDEGVGVHVVRALEHRTLPPNVEVVDGATAGFALVDVLADRRKVIVVDAIAADCAPGTVLRLTAADLAPQLATPLSLHEVGLAEALAATRQLGIAPQEVVVIGVRPDLVECGLELSPRISALVPRMVELVLAELGCVAAGLCPGRHDGR